MSALPPAQLRRCVWQWALAVLIAFLLLARSNAVRQVGAESPAVREPLTVMSFNIRFGTAKDGENHWNARRSLLISVLQSHNADLIGLQEALSFQIREIIAALPQYAVVGVGRDDGKATGEYSAILFRRNRFHVAEAGTFWFSDTPTVVASRTWGNQITRICTWARFVDRDGFAFWHYNVHLDHQSQPSRERSTELLARRVEARLTPEPVIITGDFNVGEDNPALRALVAPGSAGAKTQFVDTYRVLHPDAREVGTFNGFKMGQTNGPKIDYVFAEPKAEVLHAEIVRASRRGRYPSDHFPVVARMRLPR
jgi:endonuclease/exonuclease/phosphatase family metal-dependent hydrolase